MIVHYDIDCGMTMIYKILPLLHASREPPKTKNKSINIHIIHKKKFLTQIWFGECN